MNQESAKRLVDDGATLLVLDMPVGTQFGLDMYCCNVGEKFRGVKMIPPGLHFIYYSSVNKYGDSSPRSGFFHVFKSREILIKKWDARDEQIVDSLLSTEEFDRLQYGITNYQMDRYLGPYSYETYDRWVGLTDYIDESLVKKLNPKCGVINSVTTFTPKPFQMSKSGETREQDNVLPDLDIDPDTVINFTKIPEQNYPLGSTARDITKHSLDSTFLLDNIVDSCQSHSRLLGEIQMSFVTFLVGQVFDSFEHWKRLFKILCTSDEALMKYSDLYINFIRVLHFQLKEVPSDIFVDIVDNYNFLIHVLREFFSNIASRQSIDQSLKKRAGRFKNNLTKIYRWDFDGIPADEEPIVVDVD